MEFAFENAFNHTHSESSGRPALYGFTPDGRIIFVVYELDIENGDDIVAVVTAYQTGEE